MTKNRSWRRCHLAIATLVLTVTLFGTLRQPVAQGWTTGDLDRERRRLLAAYSEFKNPGQPVSDPFAAYRSLTPDRQALFDAITRALFIEPQDRNRNTLGPPLITQVEGVEAIWGARPGETEGRYQFRMTMRWDPGILNLLRRAENLPKKRKGHVLHVDPPGADDNLGFANFKLQTSGIVTFRQARPGLQLSFVENQPTIGEVDLDFDTGICTPFNRSCHCKPSNSDVGSGEQDLGSTDQHLARFNDVFAFFPTPLMPNGWDSRPDHCRSSYR